jgi:hypothetical protein
VAFGRVSAELNPSSVHFMCSVLSISISQSECMTLLKQDSAETCFGLLFRNVQQRAVSGSV